MKRRLMMLCALLIVFAVVSAGMTMAWFTDNASGGEAVFTAGTVDIEAGQTLATELCFNPGECEEFGVLLPVLATGTASNANYVLQQDGQRAVLSPGTLGTPGTNVQAEFEYGVCPGGMVSIVGQPGMLMAGAIPIPVSIEVSCNGTDWTTLNVIMVDPRIMGDTIFNEPIPEDFNCCVKYVRLENLLSDVAPTYTFSVDVIRLEGCICDDGSDANWNPGDFSPRISEVCNIGTKDIVLRAKLTKNWYEYNEGTSDWEEWIDPPLVGPEEEPPVPKTEEAVLFECVDPCVSLDPVQDCCCSGFGDDWILHTDGYYYYVGTEFGEGIGVIPGTFMEPGVLSEEFACLEICLPIYFNHYVGNEYQGKRFILGIEYEAVQASNCASDDLWGLHPADLLVP